MNPYIFKSQHDNNFIGKHVSETISFFRTSQSFNINVYRGIERNTSIIAKYKINDEWIPVRAYGFDHDKNNNPWKAVQIVRTDQDGSNTDTEFPKTNRKYMYAHPGDFNVLRYQSYQLVNCID